MGGHGRQKYLQQGKQPWHELYYGLILFINNFITFQVHKMTYNLKYKVNNNDT